MISNDEQQGRHFLEWVNMERLDMGQHIPWYSLQQVKEGQFIEAILQKLQCDFFREIFNVPFNYSTYLAKIQQYLDKFFGIKLKRNLRNEMLRQQSPKNLLKIIFYICVQCSAKNQYIHRIFSLSSKTQTDLMNSLKNIQENLENIVQMKDILSKFQQLEEQNDILKDKVKQRDNIIISIRQLLRQSNQQNVKIQQECNLLKKQKDYIMEELKITEMNEYIPIYRQLKNQNDYLLQSLQILQIKYNNTQQNSQELKEKISQDHLVIQHLNQQINKLKNNCQNAWLQMSYYKQRNFDYLPLKQNKSISNAKSRKSLAKSVNRFHLSPLLDKDDIEQNDKIRQYNSQLMKKLELMYKKVTIMSEQIAAIKQQNQLINKQNNFNKQKIIDLKQLHQQFIQSYPLAVYG